MINIFDCMKQYKTAMQKFPLIVHVMNLPRAHSRSQTAHFLSHPGCDLPGSVPAEEVATHLLECH